MSYTLVQKRLEEITLDPHLLDAGEKARYRRWVDPERKEEFLAGRCFLKRVLGQHLSLPPSSISLSLTKNGRPYLPAIYGPETPHFSLAHAGDLFLIGLSGYPIGVDLEPGQRRSPQSLRPFFSAAEWAHLSAMATADQQVQLLRLFTLKEAFIKATDRRWGLDAISFSPENGSWKLDKPSGHFAFHHWETPGFTGAVCLSLPGPASPPFSFKVGLKAF